LGYRPSTLPFDLDRLEVRPATEIRTTLLLNDDDAQLRIDAAVVDFFVDSSNRRVWIATRSIGGVIPKVALAVNRLMGELSLKNLAPLEAIFGLPDKDGIESELDERNIPRLDHAERTQVDWNDSAGEEHEPSSYLDESAALYERDELEPVEERAEPSGRLTSPGSRPSTRAPSQTEPGPRQPSTGRTGQATGHDHAPPTTPGHGRTTSAVGDKPSSPQSSATSGTTSESKVSGAPSSSSGSRSPKGRFVTYVVSGDEGSTQDADGAVDRGEANERATEIGRRAVERVLEFERSEGRVPHEMEHLNPGYDIESTASGAVVRYIEVKGIDGPWDDAGVRVSDTQFRFAQERGEAAWLYVCTTGFIGRFPPTLRNPNAACCPHLLRVPSLARTLGSTQKAGHVGAYFVVGNRLIAMVADHAFAPTNL
jgi:hypothetical protein